MRHMARTLSAHENMGKVAPSLEQEYCSSTFCACHGQGEDRPFLKLFKERLSGDKNLMKPGILRGIL